MGREDLTGRTFNRLTAIAIDEHKKYSWICKCTCYNFTSVASGDLKAGKVKSCGCLLIEVMSTHGLSNNRLYDIWSKIKARCYNKNDSHYKYYGERGISLAEYWINNVKDFIDYVSGLEGFGTEDYSLDRINNDGNYERDNLRWTSKTVQARNTREVKLNLEQAREIKSLYPMKNTIELAKMFNVSPALIANIVNGTAWKDA